jgi:hypothetical protein
MSNLFGDVLSCLVMRPTGSTMTGYISTASPGCVSYPPQSLRLMFLLGFHVHITFANRLFLCCHLSTDSFFLPLCRYISWIVLFLSRFSLCFPLLAFSFLCCSCIHLRSLSDPDFALYSLFLLFSSCVCAMSLLERCTDVMVTHHWKQAQPQP